VAAVGTPLPEAPTEAASPPPAANAPPLELQQLQEAWQRTILPAVEEKSIPTASMLREARPAELSEDTLTVEFPAAASFHRRMAEDPKNATMLKDALYEVTGRRLSLAFAEGEPEAGEEPVGDTHTSEEELLALMKETFDAHEVEEPR